MCAATPNKTPEVISKYFFKPNGEIEIPPPGAVINGVKIMGLMRPTTYSPTPLSAAEVMRKRFRKKARKGRKSAQEFFSTPKPVRLPSPLSVGQQHNPILVVDDDDDDDEEEVEVVSKEDHPSRPLFEFEELSDEEEEEEEEEMKPVDDDGKHFVFVENKDELKFVCSRLDKRPNEQYLIKRTWTREDIDDFLGKKLGFTPEEIVQIISLSKDVFKLAARLYTDYCLLQEGITERMEFIYHNSFDFRTLTEKLDELYKVEKRPRQHLIMFLVPGSKPKFVASDLPCWMTVNQKRQAAHLLFCPPNRPIKRVLYWANQTSDIKEPLRTFGDQSPCDVSSIEPPIERKDHITTAFIGRFWKLELLFSVPEFF
jgi:hypothetical protein